MLIEVPGLTKLDGTYRFARPGTHDSCIYNSCIYDSDLACATLERVA